MRLKLRVHVFCANNSSATHVSCSALRNRSLAYILRDHLPEVLRCIGQRAEFLAAHDVQIKERLKALSESRHAMDLAVAAELPDITLIGLSFGHVARYDLLYTHYLKHLHPFHMDLRRPLIVRQMLAPLQSFESSPLFFD